MAGSTTCDSWAIPSGGTESETPIALPWSNVAYGTISGNTLNLNWADVPKGSIMQNGILTLNVVSNNKLQAIQKTGGFGGSIWTR